MREILMGEFSSGPGSSAVRITSPVLLHVFNSFGSGGAQTRFVQIANHFGPLLRHVIVARNGDYSAATQLRNETHTSLYPWEPRSTFVSELRKIADVLAEIRPHRLITHNWGTINWVIANGAIRTRHIHIEDGFGPDEAVRLKWRRMIARRLLLSRSEVVVPSLTLKRIAETRWRIAPKRLHYIPNGIDLSRFPPQQRNDTSARKAVPVVGTVAALRPEKNFARLLRAFALVLNRHPCQLIIVGDGPVRRPLESLAANLGIAASVTFAGHTDDPIPFYQNFDVFVLTSDTEQMPYTVLEAMASGLPVVSTDVGDIASMVSPQNVPLIVGKDDEQIASAITRAIVDEKIFSDAGEANRVRARERFDQTAMFNAFVRLYQLPVLQDVDGRERMI